MLLFLLISLNIRGIIQFSKQWNNRKQISKQHLSISQCRIFCSQLYKNLLSQQYDISMFHKLQKLKNQVKLCISPKQRQKTIQGISSWLEKEQIQIEQWEILKTNIYRLNHPISLAYLVKRITNIQKLVKRNHIKEDNHQDKRTQLVHKLQQQKKRAQKQRNALLYTITLLKSNQKLQEKQIQKLENNIIELRDVIIRQTPKIRLKIE
ncbi:hypothetical protein pb186bvf_002447 [Paramecium bursaria]